MLVLAIAEIALGKAAGEAKAGKGANLVAARPGIGDARAYLGLGLGIVGGNARRPARKARFEPHRRADAGGLDLVAGEGGIGGAAERVAHGEQAYPRQQFAIARAACVHAGRHRPAELTGGVERQVAGRLERQRGFHLRRDIFGDDAEPVRGQVQLVAVEQIARGVDDAGWVGEGRADQVGDAIGRRGCGDARADQPDVEIVHDRAIGGIARQRGLDPGVEGRAERAQDLLRSGVTGDARRGFGLERDVADVACARADQRVHAAGEVGHRHICRGSCSGDGSASPLIAVGVISADGERKQVIRPEFRRGRGEQGSATGKKASYFGLETERRRRRHIGKAGGCAADREIDHRRIQQRAQRIDIIGPAREAPGGVDHRRNRVDAADAEQIAGVGIAVTKGDDARDALRRCGRGGNQRGGGKQRCRYETTNSHEKFLPFGRNRPVERDYYATDTRWEVALAQQW